MCDLQDEDSEKIYKIVLRELITFHNYKYKELVRYIYNILNNSEKAISSYTLRKYNFNDQINIIPKIFKFNCCTYELILLIDNNPMYSFIDIFDEDDDSPLKCIATFDEIDLKIENKNSIEKLKIVIDFLENFNSNYTYSPYLDEFILKSQIDNKIKLENQLNELCKTPTNDCIICYNKVHNNLITCCCGKHICRLCINKIIPLKCPNCRNDNF
jgi:hypothetical protein